MKRIIVGITGASGAILGIRALELLKECGIETHLIISSSGEKTLATETNWHLQDLKNLASVYYDFNNLGAAIASGSFKTDGMMIVPCSIKTLSAVANSYSENLISRSADVCLKEGRPLLLGVRETPLHSGHIRLMRLAARAGAIIFPPVPAFYGNSLTLDDVVTNIVSRMLFRLGIDNEHYTRWK